MSDFRLGDLIQAIDENKEAMNVQLTGSILAKDELGELIEISAEKDPDGNGVMRVYDAAPHNQDGLTDAQKTVKQSKTVRERVVNSVALEPGERYTFDLDFEFESEIWFDIQTNVEPWWFKSGVVGGETLELRTFYPNVGRDVNTTHTYFSPKRVRWLGVTAFDGNSTLPEDLIPNLSDAINWITPPEKTQIKFTIRNMSDTDSGSFTVDLLRVWR